MPLPYFARKSYATFLLAIIFFVSLIFLCYFLFKALKKEIIGRVLKERFGLICFSWKGFFYSPNSLEQLRQRPLSVSTRLGWPQLAQSLRVVELVGLGSVSFQYWSSSCWVWLDKCLLSEQCQHSQPTLPLSS